MALEAVSSNLIIHPKKHDSLAQSVEHLTFNQGVRSSNLRWVTNMKRRHDQVAKVEDCNSFIPSSNLGVASTVHAPIAQLDRVSDYESEGWGFESLWAHHL